MANSNSALVFGGRVGRLFVGTSRVCLVVVLAAFALSSACTSDDGSDMFKSGNSGGSGDIEILGGAGGDGSDVGNCLSVWGHESCDACGAAKCSASCADFSDKANADAYVQCLKGCVNDETCSSACGATYGDERDSFGVYQQCVLASCVAECSSNSTPTCDGVYVGRPDCDACLGNQCCTEVTQCEAVPNCVACVSGGGSNCNGEAGYAALASCYTSKCNTECVGGSGITPICDSGTSTGNPTCDACLGDQCCSETKQCVASPTCQACMAAPNNSCMTDSAYSTMQNCAISNCMSQCF